MSYPKTRRKFNKEMYDYLKENGHNHTIKEWVDIINNKYNETYNKKQLNEYFIKNKVEFKHEVNFKEPIGTERQAKNHDIQIKVGEPNKWQYKKRVLYEKYNNLKLNKNDIIIHLDGNKNNFSKENLYKVTTQEHLYMLNYELQSSNPDVTKLGTVLSDLKIKTKQKEKELIK